MEEKKGFGERVEAFFAGKGFYIVLFLCIAVIGVSAWSMLTEKGTDVESKTGVDITLEAREASVSTGSVTEQVIAEPAAKPAPEDSEEAAYPKPTEEAAAAVQEETTVSTAVQAESEEPAAVLTATETAGDQGDFFIWPVSGPVENEYSMTALQYSRTMQDWRTHDGIDIAAELGTQVKAASGGLVREVREDDLYGTTVTIEHGGGLMSTYANLGELPTVAVGDRVSTGQVIGAVGDTALCETGEVTHLHFSMTLDGDSVDPTEYLP